MTLTTGVMMLNYVLKCVQIDAGSVNRSDFFKKHLQRSYCSKAFDL